MKKLGFELLGVESMLKNGGDRVPTLYFQKGLRGLVEKAKRVTNSLTVSSFSPSFFLLE